MKRIPELDALRGLAALVIVIYHLWLLEYPIAGTAVDLFFVMSGYLITNIILSQRTEPHFLRKFYARRSLRIWPIYYLALAATLLLCTVFSLPIASRGIPFALTYTQHIQDYVFAPSVEFSEAFRHTWTLAIEEQFYLIWPLALVIGGRKALLPLAGSFIVAAIVARGVGFSPWILLTRGDGLALGGLLATLLRQEAAKVSAKPSSILGAAAVLAIVARVLGTIRPLGMNPDWAFSLKMLSVNLAYFALIGFVVLAAGSRTTACLRSPKLVWLGQISYGIYLYHHIVFYFIDHLGPTPRMLADVLKIGLSFGLASLSWVYIERPILSLKHRFDYHGESARSKPARGDAPVALPAPA